MDDLWDLVVRSNIGTLATIKRDGRPQLSDVNYTADADRREVTKAGETLELSRKEFELLQLLMQNAGTVVKRERLIDEVWDVNWFGSTKTLDVHISTLRKKLEPGLIHTARGVGFRFSSPEELA